MDVKIRPIEERDAQSYFRVRNEILAESNFLTLFPGEDTPGPNVAEERVNTLKKHGSEIFLASDRNILCGYLAAIRPGLKGRNHVVSISMGIKRSYWGKGIGSKLVEKLHSWVDGNNVSRIECYISSDNYRSISLFLKRGYMVEGFMRNYVRSSDGISHGKYVLAKIFGSAD